MSDRALYYEFTFQGVTPQAAEKFLQGRCLFYGFNLNINTQLIEGYIQFPTNRLFPYYKYTVSYTSQTLNDFKPPDTPWQYTWGTLKVPKSKPGPRSSPYVLFINKLEQEAAAKALLRISAKRKAESYPTGVKAKFRPHVNFVQKFSRESDLSIKGDTPPVESQVPQ